MAGLLDGFRNWFRDRKAAKRAERRRGAYFGKSKTSNNAKKKAAGKIVVHAKKKSTNQRINSASTGPSAPFRAVSIRASGTGCEAAARIKSERFLATFAPQLPLGGCSNAQQCRCRYRYHTDRRVALRRDSDHGLPPSAYHASNRRYRRDRRAHTSVAM